MPEMTEAQLALEVRRLAARYGVHAVHLTDSRTAIGVTGMPDWILIGSAVIWRELKSPYGAMETAQTDWKYRLLAAGQNWGIWRPLDLQTGRIAGELEAIRSP
jgi:hypothetical protein